MPTRIARLKARNLEGGGEVLIASLAVLTGFAYFNVEHTPAPPSIVHLSPYLSYAWGAMWITASLLLIVGTFSGKANLLTSGRILFIGLLITYIPSLIFVFGLRGTYVVVLSLYLAVWLTQKVLFTVQDSRNKNRYG